MEFVAWFYYTWSYEFLLAATSLTRYHEGTMQRTTVLLLYGGESSEHDVSISSARNVYAAIDDATYDVLLCFIDREGKWWLVDEFEEYIDLSMARQLSADLGSKSFSTTDGAVVIPNVILPILHGRNGEDGSVQGVAQLLHIPIVGCDMTGSVLAMDKIASKQICTQNDIPIMPFRTHHIGDPLPSMLSLAPVLGDVVFVKPSRAGSSVGVSRVTSQDELNEALELAHQHDEFVLIEKAATQPRELEVAILGNPPHHEVSCVGEIRPEGEFYSYESKYASGSQSQTLIPAEIDDELAQRVQALAHKAYGALKCRGMARVDFLLDHDGSLYFNEINTIPGFTNISMYPKLWRAGGVSYGALIDRLLSTAIE